MKAKAAVFVGANQPFEIREFDVTPTPAGFGRSSLIASGVCGTDLHIHNGKLDNPPSTIIGHEFVGKLEDCNPEEAAKYGLAVGDNVVAYIAVSCGECLLCKNGDDANCVNMVDTVSECVDVAPHLYGGYAEVNYTPLANLIKIPAELDPVMTATFACPGPTCIHAFRLAERAGLTFGKDTVAVVQGMGPVGCFAMLYLKALGVKKLYNIIFEPDRSKEELARSVGADEVLNLVYQSEEEITAKLQAENGGLGVDLCFEASGAPVAVKMGIDILRNRGVYLVPGQYSNSGGVEIQPQLITFKALQILGSSQYSYVDVELYLQFLCAHKEVHDTIRKLGTAYSVEDVNHAFEEAKSKKNVKTMLVK